jgi:hypothetical protein
MDLRPLSRDFGAEVLGVSLADVADDGPRGDEAYAFVRAAFEQHSVLLFRQGAGGLLHSSAPVRAGTKWVLRTDLAFQA